jgi:hypothetical protein
VNDEALFLDLAERLRSVNARVVAIDASDREKSRILRRFRAITNASKHDLGRASKQLDDFVADLDSRFPPG